MDKKSPLEEEKKRRFLQRPKKNGRLRRAYIAAAAIAVVVLIALAWHQYQSSQAARFQSRLNAVQNGESETFQQANPDTPLYVLLLGVDGNDSSQANFVGLAAINPAKKHIDFIMLPDNTKIEGRKEKGVQALQDVYREGGRTLVQAVVEDMFHIPIPFYAEFTADSFVRLIDMSGGLPMYVERNMYHADAGGQTDISLFQGYQVLTGTEALGYMRYIDTDGYLARTQRQERLVKLFYADRQTHFGLANLLLAYRFWNYVDSNIAAKDMARLAFSFRHVPADDISFYILPGETMRDGNPGGESLLTDDPIDGQKLIGKTNNAIAEAPVPSGNMP